MVRLSIRKRLFNAYGSSLEVVQRLALLAHSMTVLGSNLMADWAFAVHVLIVTVWVYSRHSGCLPHLKNILDQVKWLL